MKKGDIDFQCTNDVVVVIWFDNRGVSMVGKCLEECNNVSKVTLRVNVQSAKIPAPCPDIIKDCNSGMGGANLLIKKQLLTNWTTSHLVDVIVLDCF